MLPLSWKQSHAAQPPAAGDEGGKMIALKFITNTFPQRYSQSDDWGDGGYQVPWVTAASSIQKVDVFIFMPFNDTWVIK